MPTDEPSSDAELAGSKPPLREVNYRYSKEFLPLLESLGATLLVSTYQAGKLAVIGSRQATLNLSLHNFEQAMGIAVHPRQIAVGSRGLIWFLQSAPELAPRIEPAGNYRACYLSRSAFSTGNIHAHELAWVGDELWIVNTLFSCLCTLHEDFSFVPRWRPPFISALEANDRCHLNGLAVDERGPRFVTVMAPTDTGGGWRATKATSGQVLDVDSGQAVTHGLAMPHSPRLYRGQLLVLNSGWGTLEVVDLRTGQRTIVARLPGYARGLAFCGDYALVGLSRIRETAVFGGIPIAEYLDQLRCGVAVVDLRSGESVAYIEFETGVEEIFAVDVVPGAECVALAGPHPIADGTTDIWVVPPPGDVPTRPIVR